LAIDYFIIFAPDCNYKTNSFTNALSMNHQRILIFLFVFCMWNGLSAQPLWWMGQKKPYTWQFGIGWNGVVDHGRMFCQPFDVKQSWNLPVFPSRVMVDRYLKNGLSVEFAGAYNQYGSDKLINGMTGQSGLFISADLNCKFSFYQLIQVKWFDPYVSMGFGGTYRNNYDPAFTTSANISLGVNFWAYRNWGVQLQSSAKFGLTAEPFTSHANYLQHTASIVYKLPERRNRGTFHKKHYKWTKSRQKYRGSKRGGR
jgi:hypothetical protein